MDLENKELVEFLRAYIRIRTDHPSPDYAAAISFIKGHSERDGFEYREVELPSGNKVVVISLIGSDPSLPALALNHHMDVVPAPPEGWTALPFDATIIEGNIIGRGAQDMKSIGAIHYFALRELKRSNVPLRRSVHIFAVPEEEIGGFKGTKEFIATPEFSKLNIGFVIDEGHSSADCQLLDIKISERKPIQIQITSKGDLSHGSRLNCVNSIHRIVRFLDSMVSIHSAQQSKVSEMKPGQLLSCNITSLTAGVRKDNGQPSLNIVPAEASATIDIRVPPTMKNKQVIELLDGLISVSAGLSYKILAQATEEPELNVNRILLYLAAEKTINKFKLGVQPHYFEASSDLRFYLAKGIDGVGLSPFTIVDNIHGLNESVPIDELIRGKDIMVQLIKDFCLWVINYSL